MYQVGLKIWSINTDFYLQEAARLYADGLYSYIELFIVPESISKLQKWVKLQGDFGIPFIVHNAHFMQHFNLAKREFEASNRKIYFETKKYADALHAKYIIFHGGIDGNIEETARQLESFHESRALIENKPFRALPNSMGGNFCHGYNIPEIQHVMNTAHCGFCLDIGHAVCSANSLHVDPYEYIQEISNNLIPSMYHLTDIADISSEFDSHPHLGAGQLNLGKVIRCIRRNSKITLETEKKSKENISDFEDDVRMLHFFDLKMNYATQKDMQDTFSLSNDPVVRVNSFSQDSISWETHTAWFQKKTNDPVNPFVIIRNLNNEFVGQLRLEKKQLNQYEVSFGITMPYRGLHFSSSILKQALDFLKNDIHGILFARIKETNSASIKSFQSVGFKTTKHQLGVVILNYEI